MWLLGNRQFLETKPLGGNKQNNWRALFIHVLWRPPTYNICTQPFLDGFSPLWAIVLAKEPTNRAPFPQVSNNTLACFFRVQQEL